MCSGIILTEEISESVTNEVKGLFGAEDFGVKCMGEDGQKTTFGDGGRRHLVCVLNVKSQGTYKLTPSLESVLVGIVSENDVKTKWMLDDNTKTAQVSPGQKQVSVLLLDIPDKVSDTSLKFKIVVTDPDGNTEDHFSFIEVKHVGTLNSAIC